MLIGGALDALVVRDDPLTACHRVITGSYQPERLHIEGSWKMSNSPIQFAAVYGNNNWKHHAIWTTFNNTEMGQQVQIITHTRQRPIYPAYMQSYILTTMAVDDLVAHGAKALAAMLLNECCRKNSWDNIDFVNWTQRNKILWILYQII